MHVTREKSFCVLDFTNKVKYISHPLNCSLLPGPWWWLSFSWNSSNGQHRRKPNSQVNDLWRVVGTENLKCIFPHFCDFFASLISRLLLPPWLACLGDKLLQFKSEHPSHQSLNLFHSNPVNDLQTAKYSYYELNCENLLNLCCTSESRTSASTMTAVIGDPVLLLRFKTRQSFILLLWLLRHCNDLQNHNTDPAKIKLYGHFCNARLR